MVKPLQVRATMQQSALWDVETGTHKKTLKGHKSVIFGMLFSPDGKTLASASVDKTIRLWDVNTGEQKKILIRTYADN